MKTTLKLLSIAFIFSLFVVSCDKTEDEVIDEQPEEQLEGIQGEWYSSGSNVAALLVTYFKVDSIYAKFNTDNTYLVKSYDTDGVITEYTGTYVQTENEGSKIWTIKLSQSTPSAGASEGIFEVDEAASGYDMRYEIVQTEPDLGNVPPTATTGFGGSNGGLLGDINIQKYYRIEK